MLSATDVCSFPSSCLVQEAEVNDVLTSKRCLSLVELAVGRRAGGTSGRCGLVCFRCWFVLFCFNKKLPEGVTSNLKEVIPSASELPSVGWAICLVHETFKLSKKR